MISPRWSFVIVQEQQKSLMILGEGRKRRESKSRASGSKKNKGIFATR